MTSEIKPICGSDRVKLAQVVPLDTPFSMFVFPTTYCNFKCLYCAHVLGKEEMEKHYNFKREMMSIDTYAKVLDQVKAFPNKLKMLNLTGHGEPMLNKDLSTMIKLAKEADVAERIEVISNGSLLTKDMADKLISAGLDTLRISLQGLTSKKYKEICGFDLDFKVFMDNIKYFYNNKKNTKLFVKIMDVALDKGEEELFYNIFSDCSDRMYVERMRPTYDGVEATKGMSLDYDRYGRKHENRKVCPLPFFMLGVFPNGDVEPCDTLYKPIVLGNVHDNTLRDMWQSKALKEFWKLHLEGLRCNNKRCAVCCAPDDVSHPEDILDQDAEKILERLDK